MEQPPLVVLVLGGVAERRGCPPAESPLAAADTPNLDRLAREGRVFAVRLVEEPSQVHGVASLLGMLGIDPARHETARASYLAAEAGIELGAGECVLSADFLSLFREIVADVEPAPLRPAEAEVLVQAADGAMHRAGFRLVPRSGSHHLAIAPRSAVDEGVPAPVLMLGRELSEYEPQTEQHALAHRLAREALDGHEVNAVRRDLGANGADLAWLWGPGGGVGIETALEEPASAFAADPHFRAVCSAAGVPLREPGGGAPEQLVAALAEALPEDRTCFLYARRGVRDALMRERRLRIEGIAELDSHLVGAVADVVAACGGRLLVLPDLARETETGRPLDDAVPALLWGAGVEAVSPRPFTEEGAAAAGEPLGPGYGILPYVRRV
jgi:2,3-bisphosphoglycerate-independent phosphoglycerate mutase